MKPIRIALVADEFVLGSPAQQLLDRFLLGYPRDGEVRAPASFQVRLHLAGPEAHGDLTRPREERGLQTEAALERALDQADGCIVVPQSAGMAGNDSLIEQVLQKAPEASCVFVHGPLAGSLAAARHHLELARARGLALAAGTSVGVTWRLPDIDLPLSTPVQEALILVQGSSRSAPLDGLDGLLPILERRRGGESGVQSVRFLSGEGVWQAKEKGEWSWDLLAAAISRSDSPQGDPVQDGRTQDLVGLGLVPKLAREPRAWLIEHHDGVRSSILALDGVVADYNFAIRPSQGAILSAQLYRPPKPAQHQFSRLAAVIDDFFQSRTAPWPVERAVLLSGLLDECHRAAGVGNENEKFSNQEEAGRHGR